MIMNNGIKNSFKRRFKSITSLSLALIMILSNLGYTTAYASENIPNSQNYNKDISIDIEWRETKNSNLNVHSTTANDRNIAQRITYSSKKVSRDYNPGELRIVVKGLKDLHRRNNLFAEVGADKEGIDSGRRDWSYTYNSASDEYTLKNKTKISKDSTLDGFFDIVYPSKPLESVNGFSKQGLNATLYYPDGTMNKTRDLSIENTTEKSLYTVSIDQDATYSSAGLNGFVNNPDNYILLKYQLAYTFTEKARNLKNETFIFTAPSGSIACNNNVKAAKVGDGFYKVDLSRIYKNFIYIAVPKTYLGQTITTELKIEDTFYEETDKSVFKDSVKTVLPIDFYYTTPPGDAYNFYVEDYETPLKSSKIQSQNGQDYNYYLNVSYNKQKELHEIEAVADNSFITKADGKYRLVETSEYTIDSIKADRVLNDAGTSVVSGGFEVYACKSNVFNRDNGTLVASGKLKDFYGEYDLPEGTHSVGIIYKNLTESINSRVIINQNIKITNDNNILFNNGLLSSSGFARFFEIKEIENPDGGEPTFEKIEATVDSTVHDITGVDVEALDDQNYGADVDLTRDNDFDKIVESYNYMSSKTELKDFNIGNINEITTKGNLIANFEFDEDEAPTKFSLYTILPKGINLKNVENANDLFDNVTISYDGKRNLSSEYMSSYCSPEIIENYNNSGRTYLAFNFNFKDKPLDTKCSLNISMNLLVDNKFIENNGMSVNFECYLFENSGLKMNSINLVNDDGFSYGGDIYKDVNKNGKTNDLIAVYSTSKSFVIPESGQLSAKKSVKGSNENSYKTNSATEIGKDYTYSLEIRNGSSLLKNVILTDNIESLGEFKGTFKDVEFSKGFSGTFDQKTGTIKINEPINKGQVLNVYLKMSVPNDVGNIDKIAKNEFSLSALMVNEIEEQDISLKSNTSEVKVIDRVGNISLLKVDFDSNAPLEGATFELYKETLLGTKGDLIETKKTNSKGLANFKNLNFGKNYIAVETEAPEGYKVNKDNEIKINLDEDLKTVKVNNERLKGSLNVNKVNNLDKSIKVENAKFELTRIYEDSNDIEHRDIIGTYKTNSKGEFKASNLNWGDYELKEIKAPEGYEIDSKNQIHKFTLDRFNVKNEVNLEIENTQKDVLITLNKFVKSIDDKETTDPLQGAHFDLYKVSVSDDGNYELKEENLINQFITNDLGQIKINNLAYGNYVLSERIAPAGYELCENILFNISPNNREQTFTVYDKMKPGNIVIQKCDSNDNIVTGAGFTLYDKDMNPIIEDKISDKQGIIVFDNLKWDKYYVKETVAPEGYIVDETVHEVNVNGTNLNQRIKVVNNEVLGKILVEKVDSDTKTILPGAEFKLCKNDGTVVHERLVTDDKGQFKVDNLKWGSYYLEEIKAPNGYQIDSTKHQFVVNYKNAAIEQKIVIENSISNNKSLKITKTIDPNDNWEAHGDIVFNYNISYLNTAGEKVFRNASIKFDNSGNNGNNLKDVSKTITLDKIPSNVTNVEIYEYTTNRYQISSVTKKDGTTLSGGTKQSPISFNISENNNENEIIFKNVKNNWKDYSDASTVVNHISKEANEVGLKVKFNHEGSVTANSPIDKNELEVILYYDDGKTRVLSHDEYTLDAEKWPNKPGDFLVTVTYHGLTDSFIGYVDPNTILVNPVLANLNNNTQLFTDLGIVKNDVKYIEFTNVKVPEGVKTAKASYDDKNFDYTEDIISWFDNASGTLYFSTQNPALTIELPKNCAYFFQFFESLIGINDLIGLDTSNVTYMKYMFYHCSSITTLDLSKWNTSNVKDMGGLFYGCTSLTTLDVSNWDTSSVTSMSFLFRECTSLTTLDVSNWDTSNVEYMKGTFYNCRSLTKLDVSNWNVSNVEYMGGSAINDGLFSCCIQLKQLNLSNWNTGKNINFGNMFQECSSLITLDVSNWNTSNATKMFSMFQECSSLITLDVSNWDTSNVEDMEWIFSDCQSLTNLDVSSWNTSNVKYMNSAFYNCKSLTELDVSNWNVSNVRNMERMFYYCKSLITLDVSNWNVSNVGDMSYMFTFCSNITSLNVLNFNTSKVTNMKYIFKGCNKLLNLDVSNWNTFNVTNMFSMFDDCSSLTSLDTSNWDTSNVTDMNSMFSGCHSLTTLDVSNWDTSNVEDIRNTFYNCKELIELDVSKWDTSNVTNMNNMFDNCRNLTSLDVSKWKTSNLKSATSTFYKCRSLTTLDVSSWDTSNVEDMGNMFAYCESLINLDLSGWDTSNVTSIYGIFNNCSSLKTLNVSGWDTSKIKKWDYAFEKCSSLTDLDLSNWNTSNATSMYGIFQLCSNLTTVYCRTQEDINNFETKTTNTPSNVQFVLKAA